MVKPNSIKENTIVSNKESVKDTYTFTFETNELDAENLMMVALFLRMKIMKLNSESLVR
jgi:hypothetical protein